MNKNIRLNIKYKFYMLNIYNFIQINQIKCNRLKSREYSRDMAQTAVMEYATTYTCFENISRNAWEEMYQLPN